MDLETALKRIEYIKTHKHVDLEMKVYIAPKRDKDYEMFIACFFDDEDKIELAQSLSIDEQFRLCAIWEFKNKTLKDIPNIDNINL